MTTTHNLLQQLYVVKDTITKGGIVSDDMLITLFNEIITTLIKIHKEYKINLDLSMDKIDLKLIPDNMLKVETYRVINILLNLETNALIFKSRNETLVNGVNMICKYLNIINIKLLNKPKITPYIKYKRR
jgi:hypothetical protein